MAIADILAGMGGTTILAVVGVTGLVVLWNFLSVQMDPREPPLLKPAIPFIGHIISMVRYHHEAYSRLGYETRKPIVTMPLLNSKMYVINSVELMNAVFRTKNLSFDPYVAEFLGRIGGVSAEAMAKFRSSEFRDAWYAVVTSKLSGEPLRRTNALALAELTSSLNKLPRDGPPVELDLWAWMRDVITLATMTALFGSKSPWKADPSMIDTYWKYQSNLIMLLVDVMPSVTAPRGHQSRRRMFEALTAYFGARHDLDDDVAPLTKAQLQLEREHSFRTEDSASMAIPVLHAAVSNTMPSTFWLVSHIVSDRALSEQLRDEVAAAVAVGGEAGGGGRDAWIDLSRLDERCPLLMSVFRESMRVNARGTLQRRVTVDTHISDGDGRTYLLKKGMNVAMSQQLMLAHGDTWGPSAGDFDARRFLQDNDASRHADSTDEEKARARQRRRAFVPFGGGASLCPGRNLASSEMLATAIILLLGFDITALDGGPFRLPSKAPPAMSGGIPDPAPSSELRVKVGRRKGWEDVNWKMAASL